MDDAKTVDGSQAFWGSLKAPELYRFFIEEAADGIFIGDPQGRYLAVNPQAVALTGYSVAELLGMSAADLIPAEDLTNHASRMADLRPGRSAKIETRIRRKDGGLLDVEISSRILPEGHRIEMVADITERKRAEATSAGLSPLLEESLNEIYVFDADTLHFTAVNRGARENLGYTLEELRSLTPLDLKPELDAQAFAELIRPLRTGAKAKISFESRHRRKNNSLYDVEVHLQTAVFEGRAVFVAIIIDVTARKLAEEELRQANLVIENSPVVVFRWRATEGWPVAMVSRNVIQFGYTPEELLSGAVPFAALVHPEDLEQVGREVLEYSQSGAERFEQEYRIVTRDGAVRWVDDRTVVERDDGGRIVFYQGIVIDITARKLAEAELRERENLLGSIFRASPTGIGVVSDRVLLAVNDRVCQMIGCSRDELIGRSARVLYPGDADFEYVGTEKYRQIRERGTGSVETRWQCRDGRIIDVLMSSTPIDPGNLAAGVTFTALDITERKRAEAALRSSLEEKESLLKEVHHRVKNTLQVISSLLSLQVHQAGSAAVRSFLQDTQNRVRSMAVLHEILYRSSNLARISFPQYVKSICAHLARSYAADAGNIRLRREIAEISLSMDQAVPAGLIINELVSNAFKHAFPDRDGGEILVQVLSDDDRRLVLRVADDGVGMPDKTNQGAESLGLRLVDNLVRQLDGRLTIRSDPGAAFQIVFPLRPAERSDA